MVLDLAEASAEIFAIIIIIVTNRIWLITNYYFCIE